MAAFEYVAFDAKGSRKKGLIEADTVKQARQQLRGLGFSPVEVEPVSSQQQSRGSKMHKDKISVPILSLITRQLSTLISAGQPVESAIYAVSQQTNKPQAKKVLLSVRARVLEGYALSDAMREFPRIFDAMYCASVHAGEQSGLLDIVMERLADFMESRQNLQQKTKLALIYPILLTVVSILLVSGLLTFVVPQIIQVFEGFDQELPILTQYLIILSDFFKEHGIQVILSIIILSFSYTQLLKLSWVRVLRDRLLLKLPLISYLVKLSNTSRFTRTMSLLVSSGVPALDAMHIATEVVTNSIIQKTVIKAADNVREGGSISESLTRTGYFSPLVLQLISNGESSGKLGEMLERSAKAEESEFEGMTALFLGVFEPAMILVMGGVVLVIVLAILLPIFDMNDLIQ
ncbi:MAG: type II secretion system inner membrane protein GspF [Gammaproteobacteria bacterium]|nr:type II secretion system inner membrane protein GspF [Gammaproteobacteria bacterium]MBL7000412.1 type II secretion system inner membrane protein GspF [Gammaproteobacteria bacterium]MBL7000594.1 type II secretion system inner membrane protein GspF [Gammaproteobacteria bacterium]